MRFISICALIVALQFAAFADAPKYIFFNIAPGAAHCYTEEAIRGAFDDVPKTLHAVENPRLRIGVSFVLSTLETPTDVLSQRVRTILQTSEKTSVPVLIAFDGQNWWQSRPDLWNWWDPTKPGYNPSNVFNVEWTGWSCTNAIKISWRNWGVIHRVAPAQNIASPRVIELQQQALRQLLPIVVQWYQSLPTDRKLLCGGIKVGWEASIGYNAYYYPNGNRYFEQSPGDSSLDPSYEVGREKGISAPERQLGYAALQSLGIKNNGKITADDIAKVTAWYLEKLSRTAHECGLPKDLVFTHQGGTYKPWDKHLPFSPALNQWSMPGWSFYGIDPNEAHPLTKTMNAAKQQSWAACEWWWGGGNAREWEDHFTRTLRFRDCRFIDVYNWNPAFRDDAAAQEAVRKLISKW